MKNPHTNTRKHQAALAALLLIGLTGCGKALPTSPVVDLPSHSASAAPAILSTPLETGEGGDSGGGLAPSGPVLDGRTPGTGDSHGNGHAYAYGRFKAKKAKKN